MHDMASFVLPVIHPPIVSFFIISSLREREKAAREFAEMSTDWAILDTQLVDELPPPPRHNPDQLSFILYFRLHVTNITDPNAPSTILFERVRACVCIYVWLYGNTKKIQFGNIALFMYGYASHFCVHIFS